VQESIKELIESGNYYSDAKSWYHYKYIQPISQRSYILLFSSVAIVVFLGIVVNIKGLLPLTVQIRYLINADASTNKTAQILRANQIEDAPTTSIADILIKNYVLKRESYRYDDLKKQFVFVKNNSTRIVFRKFYNFMNIDNPTSPVMTYQKSISRTPTIISTKYPGPNKAIVKFGTTAQDASGTQVENMVWQATIDYEIDDINPNLPNNTRFNFTITDYQLTMLKDKKTNNL
jgi:type IV secretion system protein VirB8